MTDSAGSWIAVLVGFTVLRLSLTDLYLRYVRSGMRPWLVLAGVVLVGVGVMGLLARRRRHIGEEADGASGTGTGAAEPGHGLPAVAALLLVPVAAVLVVAPAPLGAYAAGRQGQASSSGRKPPANLAAPKDGAVNLSLAELDDRLGAGQDLSAVRVRLVGFVSSGPAEADGFVLTRFQIACCAADARAVSVAARGAITELLRRDTWVEVVGRPSPAAGAGAAVQVESLKRISAPRDPYE